MPTAYVTAPRDVAPDLAELLVEERLAACVNIVECQSTYRWEDDIHHDPESILFVKTSGDRYEAMADRLKAEHPHAVPCIERFDEDLILPSFARWRDDAVGESD